MDECSEKHAMKIHCPNNASDSSSCYDSCNDEKHDFDDDYYYKNKPLAQPFTDGELINCDSFQVVHSKKELKALKSGVVVNKLPKLSITKFRRNKQRKSRVRKAAKVNEQLITKLGSTKVSDSGLKSYVESSTLVNSSNRPVAEGNKSDTLIANKIQSSYRDVSHLHDGNVSNGINSLVEQQNCQQLPQTDVSNMNMNDVPCDTLLNNVVWHTFEESYAPLPNSLYCTNKSATNKNSGIASVAGNHIMSFKQFKNTISIPKYNSGVLLSHSALRQQTFLKWQQYQANAKKEKINNNDKVIVSSSKKENIHFVHNISNKTCTVTAGPKNKNGAILTPKYIGSVPNQQPVASCSNTFPMIVPNGSLNKQKMDHSSPTNMKVQLNTIEMVNDNVLKNQFGNNELSNLSTPNQNLLLPQMKDSYAGMVKSEKPIISLTNVTIPIQNKSKKRSKRKTNNIGAQGKNLESTTVAVKIHNDHHVELRHLPSSSETKHVDFQSSKTVSTCSNINQSKSISNKDSSLLIETETDVVENNQYITSDNTLYPLNTQNRTQSDDKVLVSSPFLRALMYPSTNTLQQTQTDDLQVCVAKNQEQILPNDRNSRISPRESANPPKTKEYKMPDSINESFKMITTDKGIHNDQLNCLLFPELHLQAPNQRNDTQIQLPIASDDLNLNFCGELPKKRNKRHIRRLKRKKALNEEPTCHAEPNISLNTNHAVSVSCSNLPIQQNDPVMSKEMPQTNASNTDRTSTNEVLPQVNLFSYIPEAMEVWLWARSTTKTENNLNTTNYGSSTLRNDQSATFNMLQTEEEKSIGIQAGCSYKELKSVATQTVDENKFVIWKDRMAFNNYIYQYLIPNNSFGSAKNNSQFK